MGSVLRESVPDASESGRQLRRQADTSVGDVLTDIAKRVLWPENTAAHIAAAARCSVRQAERCLGGHCDWSGDAVAAIIGEIVKRRGMRNIKIKPRLE